MKKILLPFIIVITSAYCWGQDTVRVACVGNSITYGHGIKNRLHDGYPAVLGRLLGDGYKVENFGVSGRTLLSKGDHPYIKEKAYKDALAFKPNIVVVKLGTNDSKPFNWVYKNDFKADMEALIKSFQNLETNPRIIVCLPIPGDNDGWKINDSTITAAIIPYTKQVAKKMKLEVIDLHTFFMPYKHLLPDGVHPNEDGAALMASEVAKVIMKLQK